jgi:hypothetical protein
MAGSERLAFIVFVAVVCGGLALLTAGMLAAVIALARRHRRNRR